MNFFFAMNVGIRHSGEHGAAHNAVGSADKLKGNIINSIGYAFPMTIYPENEHHTVAAAAMNVNSFICVVFINSVGELCSSF